MKIKFDEDCITIGELSSAVVCLIWLHGYGANNKDFESVMKTIYSKLDRKIFIVLPNAPLSEIKQIRSWYPLPYKNSDDVLQEDCAELYNSLSSIRELLHSIIFETVAEKEKISFVIGGFSQGGALALTALCDPDTVLDGCISLSGYFPCANILMGKAKPEGENLFISHGKNDDVIDINAHIQAIKLLKTLDIKIEEVVGDFGHTVPNTVIDSIINWFQKTYFKELSISKN